MTSEQKVTQIHSISKKRSTVKKTYNIQVTHHFPSGKVLTNEEFMRKPYEIDCEKNKEVLLDMYRATTNTEPLKARDYYEKVMENKRKIDELLKEKAKLEGLI